MSALDPGMADTIHELNTFADAPSPPRTWWLASTACPLLAATFGPIASGLSVCALVDSWTDYIPDGKPQAEGIKIEDPAWLLAINAISLVCATAGNAALLLNMAKRLRFEKAQPVTISGFLAAGILLIADMAALTADPSYHIPQERALPAKNHALTTAFYHAIAAASLYIIIGLLMCITVYGASKQYYDKQFHLTAPQRTLMLQTMAFVIYLLLGALVFSHIEEWRYNDSVYWANVSLLTIGLGDFVPTTSLGRGLLFPFAVGGILMIGLVVGSIRSLVLERGKENLAAAIAENRRLNAVHNVDQRKQTIKVSWFAQADFSTDPSLSHAQRRQEEFHVMRKVQKAAERERRYVALGMSLSFVVGLWLIGALVFVLCENDWTYFEGVYFTFTVLLTIGYGDPSPSSNSGKAFFVIWSLLAVPALTILISNMGDTLVKTVSDLTTWLVRLTIRKPDALHGARKTVRNTARLLGLSRMRHGERMGRQEHHKQIMDMLSTRLEKHLADSRFDLSDFSAHKDVIHNDTRFFHFVLANEIRYVQKNLTANPQKQYEWHEWEFYLRLIGDYNDFVPETLQQPRTAEKSKSLMRRPTMEPLGNWSWLSADSPLVAAHSESEWIAEKLSNTLCRELGKSGQQQSRRPPISLEHVLQNR